MNSYLRTASPPISLYLRDSHWAIAHKPLVATFSAYNWREELIISTFSVNNLDVLQKLCQFFCKPDNKKRQKKISLKWNK